MMEIESSWVNSNALAATLYKINLSRNWQHRCNLRREPYEGIATMFWHQYREVQTLIRSAISIGLSKGYKAKDIIVVTSCKVSLAHAQKEGIRLFHPSSEAMNRDIGLSFIIVDFASIPLRNHRFLEDIVPLYILETLEGIHLFHSDGP